MYSRRDVRIRTQRWLRSCFEAEHAQAASESAQPAPEQAASQSPLTSYIRYEFTLLYHDMTAIYLHRSRGNALLRQLQRSSHCKCRDGPQRFLLESDSVSLSDVGMHAIANHVRFEVGGRTRLLVQLPTLITRATAVIALCEELVDSSLPLWHQRFSQEHSTTERGNGCTSRNPQDGRCGWCGGRLMREEREV
jgi:hypothetical protein